MSDSTANKAKIPPIPTSLLEALEREMPPLRPGLDWSERRIFHEMGRRAYLEWLRVIHDRQKEEPTVL